MEAPDRLPGGLHTSKASRSPARGAFVFLTSGRDLAQTRQIVHPNPRGHGLDHLPWCVVEEPRPGDLLLERPELVEDEELWEEGSDADHTGWFCVATAPFP